MATIEPTTYEAPGKPAVRATRAAIAVIVRLQADHGPLMFLQPGCAGTSPICIEQGELMFGPHDLWLGDIGGAPFYVDGGQYERSGKPRFIIDVSPGSSEGFSLEGAYGVHFVTRTPTN